MAEIKVLMRVPIGVFGGGVWGQVQDFRWLLGRGFPLENKGKTKRGGEGGVWGRDRQRNRQVNAHAFVKTTLQQTTLELSLMI